MKSFLLLSLLVVLLLAIVMPVSAADPPAATTTISCPPSLNLGSNSQCTVTVTSNASPQVTPTGTVAFSQTGGSGSVSFPSGASCTLASGSCAVAVAGATAGSVQIQASYSGDSNNGGSTSSSANINITGSTTTAVNCTSPVLVGTSFTCTVTVTGSSPTGTVSFTQTGGTGGIGPSSCTLSGGTCSVVLTATAAGSVTVQGTYSGDPNNSGSSITYSLTINQATSSTLVNCSPSPVVVGTATICTVTVTGYNPSSSVQWQTSGTGTFSPNPCTLSAGTCSSTYTPAAAGQVTITGQYQGDQNNGASTSNAFSLTISQTSTTTSVSCSPATVVAGSTTTCTATVTGFSPTGTVSWQTSGTGTFSPTSCVLSAGSCSVSFTPTSSGTVTASYGGDQNNLASSGTFTTTALVNLVIQFTVVNSGPATTVTLSGCSVSPTSVPANGTPQTIQAAPGCTPITATLPPAVSNARYMGAGGVTSFTISACSLGTCSTYGATVYYQLQNTYQATPLSPSAWTVAGSIPVTGTALGQSAQTICTISVSSGGGPASCPAWADYNTQASLGLLSVSQTQRWAPVPTGNSFTDTTGGNEHNGNYYSQALENFQYSLVGSSTAPPTPRLNYTAFGAASSMSLQNTASPLWLDSSSTWTATQILTGSSSTEHWDTGGNSGVATSGQSVTLKYYHQFLVAFKYTVVGNSSGYTPPTTTISSLGTPVGVTQGWADAGSTYLFTNPLAGSSPTMRWFSPSAGGTISASATITATYYCQYAFLLSFSVVGGGSFRPPQINGTISGSIESQPLTNATSTYWIDSGSKWSVSTQTPGSSATERWITSQPTSGSATSTVMVSFKYYHQYQGLVAYSVLGGGSPSAPTFNYTVYGASAPTKISTQAGQFWVDSGTKWTLPNLLPSSTTSERWIATVPTTGTATGAFNVNLPYQHEYYVKANSNSEVGGTFSNITQWYVPGTHVNLTASASPKWRFEYWNGVGSGAYNGTTAAPAFSVSGPANETAMFYPGIVVSSSSDGSAQYSFGKESGSVKESSDLTLYVPPGETLTLTAVPSSVIEIFQHWSGNITSSVGRTSIVATGPAEVSAEFGLNYPVIGGFTVLAIAAAIAAAYFLAVRRKAEAGVKRVNLKPKKLKESTSHSNT